MLEMECVLTKRRGPVGIGECKALVDGQVACVAELTFAITDAGAIDQRNCCPFLLSGI